MSECTGPGCEHETHPGEVIAALKDEILTDVVELTLPDRRKALMMLGVAVKVKAQRIVRTRPPAIPGASETREVDKEKTWMVGLRRAVKGKSVRWIVFEPGKQGKKDAYACGKMAAAALRATDSDLAWNAMIEQLTQTAEENLGAGTLEENTTSALTCAMCEREGVPEAFETFIEDGTGDEVTICKVCIAEYGEFESLRRKK